MTFTWFDWISLGIVVAALLGCTLFALLRD